MPTAPAKRKRAKPQETELARICRTLIPGYDSFATSPPGYIFDEDAVNRFLEFCETYLKFIEGHSAGQPLKFQPSQIAIIGNLMGWKRPDGTRRYREAFVYMGRGNGKTPLAAAFVVYFLFADGERGAQIASAGADADQASYCWRHVRGMIEQEPELDKRCTIYTALHSVMLKSDPGSAYKVLTSEGKTKHGGNPHLVVCDELHAWYGRELMDALQSAYAKKSRRQPLLLHLTTADYMRESICNEKYDYACRVRDNGNDPMKPGYDPAFLPVIWEAKATDDWRLESTWEQANPLIDITVDRDSLRRECQKAQTTPSYENTFKRFHLNIRTQQAFRWIAMEQWAACPEAVPESMLTNAPCYVGIDLSSTQDITAMVLYFPEHKQLKCWFYIPEATAIEKEKTDRVPYLAWSKAGYVTLSPGNFVDYDLLLAKLLELRGLYSIRKVGYDPAFAAQLQTQLQNRGFDAVRVGASYAHMSSPSKKFEDYVVGAELRHGNNPVLNWMAENVSCEKDAWGRVRPSKKASTTQRIDGIVASIIAIGMSEIDGSAKSGYASHGVDYV